MRLQHLIDAMEHLAPTRHAEPWDNVGLLCGDPARPLHRVLLCIDYTVAVAAEARDLQCDTVIAYHPPLFEPVKRIVASGRTALLHDALSRGIALYSPHTALDVADGGTNDLLAEALGLADVEPVRRSPSSTTERKLVVFVPPEAVDAVADALANVGAGRIGNYTACSFRTPGTGTFLPEDGARPAIGQLGRLEHAPEVRLEMVLPASRIIAAVEAIRATHPYETPAFDLYPLEPAPAGTGIGRIGTFTPPTLGRLLVDRVKTALQLDHLLVGGPSDRLINRAAVCAGAGRSLLDDAIAGGAELLLTGELPHHDVLKAVRAGLTVFCTLHSNSERPSLRRLADRLLPLLPGVTFHLSEADRDPLRIM